MEPSIDPHLLNQGIRAAEYVRMSTEHQQYSTQNQSERILEYANHRGMQIVRTYADEGKSGLSMDGRPALKRLIADVQSGNADFEVILVYDVSRWGRFQDADESAYYEYLCRKSGMQVSYCAEQFENDGSPVSTIVKGVKRAMAGEYSRELSAKVFAGQCRLIELGYRQGGTAGYGLRRVLIDQNGVIKAQLARGEHKSLQTDRVILRPGPQEELDTVLRIYEWFNQCGKSESDIARMLNDAGVVNDMGAVWSRLGVRTVLSNPKYIGDNVYNRISFKLKRRRIANDSENWIKKEGAFEGIVSREDFYVARGIMLSKMHRYSETDLIEKLRTLFLRKGELTGIIIDEADGMPTSDCYAYRFGSLLRAYQLVGYTPDRDYRYLEVNRLLRKMHPEIIDQTQAQIQALGGYLFRDPDTDLLTICGEFTASIVLSRCQQIAPNRSRWKVRLDVKLRPDITVVVRLVPGNHGRLDYYLLPALDFPQSGLTIGERNAIDIECYRFGDLKFFWDMAARFRFRRAA